MPSVEYHLKGRGRSGLVYRIERWQLLKQITQFGDDIGVSRRDIVQFLRIGIVVVEFSLAIAPAGETPLRGTDALAAKFWAASDQGEGRVFDTGVRITQNGPQAGSSAGVWHFQAAEVSDRGIYIDELDQRLRRLTTFHAWRGDDEWCTAAALKERVLVPPLSLAGVITVVTNEDDDRLVPKLMFVERIEHTSKLRIHETGASAVSAEQLSPFLLRELAESLGVCASADMFFSHGRHVCGIGPNLQ